jgi:hypothetical protein
MYDRQSRLYEEASRPGKSQIRAGHSYEFERTQAPEGPRLSRPQVGRRLAAVVSLPVVLVAIQIMANALIR